MQHEMVTGNGRYDRNERRLLEDDQKEEIYCFPWVGLRRQGKKQVPKADQVKDNVFVGSFSAFSKGRVSVLVRTRTVAYLISVNSEVIARIFFRYPEDLTPSLECKHGHQRVSKTLRKGFHHGIKPTPP